TSAMNLQSYLEADGKGSTRPVRQPFRGSLRTSVTASFCSGFEVKSFRYPRWGMLRFLIDIERIAPRFTESAVIGDCLDSNPSVHETHAVTAGFVVTIPRPHPFSGPKRLAVESHRNRKEPSCCQRIRTERCCSGARTRLSMEREEQSAGRLLAPSRVRVQRSS